MGRGKKHYSYIRSKLCVVCDGNLYSQCGIDDNLKLSIISGLIPGDDRRRHALTSAYEQYLCNKETIALHFNCTKEIYTIKDMPIKQTHDGTHIVGQVILGVEAIFIIDHQSTGQNFECTKRKVLNAVNQDNFNEIHNFTGECFIDNSIKLPKDCQIKTVRDMYRLHSEIEKLLRLGEIGQVPIVVDLYPIKKMHKIDSTITQNAVSIIRELNFSISCMNLLIKTENITLSVKTRIEEMKGLIKKLSRELKAKIATILPGIREGSSNVEELMTILADFYDSPFNKDLETWIKHTSNEIDAFQQNITQIGASKLILT